MDSSSQRRATPTRDRVVDVTDVDGGDAGDDAHATTPPTRVGPYVLLERIGGGGMGVVWRARDPRLERDVAIKLLRATKADAQAQARLVREAQALARFSHPNVVQVYDVGTDEGRVWVAMEFVEGVTLGHWARQTQRSVDEVLAIYRAAAEGLAAAHADGLVHRDFKPDNVFVGDDGRVRVGDFGLVRAADRSEEGSRLSVAGPQVPSRDPTGDLGATALTSAGFVLGTPAYMAPEQHFGGPTDARTDQFAWCVAVWEALYGARPFTGRAAADLAAAKLRGPPERPASPPVPSAVTRALARGMSPGPDQRFESMAALLAATDPAPRRRRGWAFALGSVVIAAVAGAFALSGGPAPCEPDEAVFADWTPQRRDAIATAFASTSLAYAPDTWTRVDALVEAYQSDWRDAYREICEATRVGGTQRADALDARMRCLDHRRDDLGGVLGAFEHPDPEIVRNAVFTVRRLEQPGACIDAGARPGVPLPDDVKRRTVVAAVLTDIGRQHNAVLAGDHREQLSRAQALAAAARDVDWDPAVARAEHLLADAYDHLKRGDEAAEHLERAWTIATASHDDEAAIDAGIAMVWLQGRVHADATAVATWTRHVEAAVDRLGPDVIEQGYFALARGGAAESLGDVEAAATHYVRAREVFVRHLGPAHPHVATALTNEGTTRLAVGDYEGARARHAEAIAIYEAELGPRHPAVAVGMDNLANALGRLGRFEEATRAREAALSIWREVLGEDHPDIAHSLVNLAATLESAGEYPAAERVARSAVALLERNGAREDMDYGAALLNLGSAIDRQHRDAEAIEIVDRGRKVLEEALPSAHPFHAFAEATEGVALRGLGRLDEAATRLRSVADRCARDAVEPALCHLAGFELARVRYLQDPSHGTEALADAREHLAALDAIAFALPPVHRLELQVWLDGADPR